tara:strand:+ start:9006 stop:10913 length:1908 start_codon:yes stop_codon:yes gene_type:complete
MGRSFRDLTSKPKLMQSFPSNQYGHEGDIVISQIKNKGVFLCVKAGNTWYAQTTMQPLQKINTAYIKDLSSDKMTIKRLENCKINADKFVVSENGDIKYRTADEILSDLGIDDINYFDINYKTAYCSLEGYSDKETCEANGGTWYYSENDSHDSISSTAENQLLTVGQSIGNLDAESKLTYDGSTLEIKYNSDYDDNWQTSAQTDLLKLTYGDNLSSKFNVASDGSLTLDVDGDITLDADGGNVIFKDGTNSIADFDVDNKRFAFYYDDNNWFRIQIGANRATSFLTSDEDPGAAGHLTLDPDGDLIISGANTKIDAGKKLYLDGGGDTYIVAEPLIVDTMLFTVGGTTMFALQEGVSNVANIKSSNFCLDATYKLFFDDTALGHTYITQSSDDILDIYVGGDKMLSLDETVDTGVTSLIGTLKIKEQADASSDTAAYGQIWVHDTTPNELMFTDDADTDISTIRHSACWGGNFARTTGLDGDWLAIPTGYQAAAANFGSTATAPVTTELVATTADDTLGVTWMPFGKIKVTGCRIFFAQGGSTNTTHKACLMKYTMDADGDLTSGVQVGEDALDSDSDDYSQIGWISLSLTSTGADLLIDGGGNNDVLVAMVYCVDAINSAMGAKCVLEYQQID